MTTRRTTGTPGGLPAPVNSPVDAPPGLDGDLSGRGPDAVRALARRCAQMGLSLADAAWFFDRAWMADALILARGHRRKAAALSGMDRKTLDRMMKRPPRRAPGDT